MAGHIVIFKNDTIQLTKVIDKDNFWLYDYTREMNLSMEAKTEQQAFVESLTYYQKRLAKVEKDFKELDDKVKDFIISVSDDED